MASSKTLKSSDLKVAPPAAFTVDVSTAGQQAMLPADAAAAAATAAKEQATTEAALQMTGGSLKTAVRLPSPTGKAADSETLTSELKATDGEPAQTPATTTPVEERPAAIAEEDWKGSLAETIRHLKSAEHFKAVEAKKAAAAPAKTAGDSGFFTEARIAEINAELASNEGKLGEKTRASLHGVGLTDEIIDSHIAGLNAVLERNTLLAIVETGGEEAYGKMMEWFGTLGPADQKLLAPAFQSKDKEVVKAAARTLKERYFAANPREPQLLSGGRAGSVGGTKPYEDMMEKQAEINDPRYMDTGPIGKAWRARVDARIRASQAAGIAV